MRDRQIDVTLSEDDLVHIEYFESEKEFYEITVSEDNVLTMTAQTNKSWLDYIGRSPSAVVRKIALRIPDASLSSLTLTTTNKDITLADLTIVDDIVLSSNGGDITFEKLAVGNILKLTAKNGNITGAIAGGYDDFSIRSEIKKGKSNLPSEKAGGDKTLEVSNNNGDIDIAFIKN